MCSGVLSSSSVVTCKNHAKKKATLNIYFKPRAISTHSHCCSAAGEEVFLAFFHTQERSLCCLLLSVSFEVSR